MRAKSKPTSALAGRTTTKKQNREGAYTERTINTKRQRPRAMKTTLTTHSTPAVRWGHAGRKEERKKGMEEG